MLPSSDSIQPGETDCVCRLETFDEVTRRQYRLKTMKHHSGPFGDDEEPRKFSSFDVFTKIRVLHQLSTWTLNNPNTIRDRMAEDETDWVCLRVDLEEAQHILTLS